MSVFPTALAAPTARFGAIAIAPLLAKTAFVLVPTGIISYMLYKLVKDELRWDGSPSIKISNGHAQLPFPDGQFSSALYNRIIGGK